MHSYESEGMSGRRPAGKFYHDSEALDRRIILERIPTMTMEDLRILNLETYAQSQTLKNLISQLYSQDNPNLDNIKSMKFLAFVLDTFAATTRDEIRYRNRVQEDETQLKKLETTRLRILDQIKARTAKRTNNNQTLYYRHLGRKFRKALGSAAWKGASKEAAQMATPSYRKAKPKGQADLEEKKREVEQKAEELRELMKKDTPSYTRVKVTRDADGNLRFE